MGHRANWSCLLHQRAKNTLKKLAQIFNAIACADSSALLLG